MLTHSCSRSQDDLPHATRAYTTASPSRHSPRSLALSLCRPRSTHAHAHARALARRLSLFSEADDGCCGHNWLTFGNPAFRDDADGGGGGGDARFAPFEVDGFERVELARASSLQLSRYDNAAFVGSSRTVAFRRRADAAAAHGGGAHGGGGGGASLADEDAAAAAPYEEQLLLGGDARSGGGSGGSGARRRRGGGKRGKREA